MRMKVLSSTATLREVSLEVDDSGGLVGHNSVDGNIISSYAMVDVVGDSNTGGLVGLNEGGITNSYATGDISGSGDGSGGLAGLNQGIYQQQLCDWGY